MESQVDDNDPRSSNPSDIVNSALTRQQQHNLQAVRQEQHISCHTMTSDNSKMIEQQLTRDLHLSSKEDLNSQLFHEKQLEAYAGLSNNNKFAIGNVEKTPDVQTTAHVDMTSNNNIPKAASSEVTAVESPMTMAKNLLPISSLGGSGGKPPLMMPRVNSCNSMFSDGYSSSREDQVHQGEKQKWIEQPYMARVMSAAGSLASSGDVQLSAHGSRLASADKLPYGTDGKLVSSASSADLPHADSNEGLMISSARRMTANEDMVPLADSSGLILSAGVSSHKGPQTNSSATDTSSAADVSNSNNNNNIWQQHNDNKTWHQSDQVSGSGESWKQQQQHQEQEAQQASSTDLNTAGSGGGVQLGPNRSGRNIGIHSGMNNNNNLGLSGSYVEGKSDPFLNNNNINGASTSSLSSSYSAKGLSTSFGSHGGNSGGLSSSFGSHKMSQSAANKSYSVDTDHMRRLSNADMCDNWRNPGASKLLLPNPREGHQQVSSNTSWTSNSFKDQSSLKETSWSTAVENNEKWRQLEAAGPSNKDQVDIGAINNNWRNHEAPKHEESTISGNWHQTGSSRQQETAALAEKWRQNDATAAETGAKIKDAADLKWRNLDSTSRSSLEAASLKWRPSLEASGGAVSGPWRVSSSSAEQLRGSSSSSEENWRQQKESVVYQRPEENGWVRHQQVQQKEENWRQLQQHRESLLLDNQESWKKDPLSSLLGSSNNQTQLEDKWKARPLASGSGGFLDEKWRNTGGGGGSNLDHHGGGTGPALARDWSLDPNWRTSGGTVNPMLLGNLPSPALATPPSWFGNLRPGEKDFRFDGLTARGDDLLNLREGLSRESSRDDINSVCDQQFDYEERFRVDRRKLELMIIGSGDSQLGEAATAFFDKISRETDTTIIWPSRLKIGAKSKKDPHIRVGGQEEGVKVAKARITEVLDTRVNSRVTIKMDVSYTDHSHIIGKGGNTIRRVMTDTNCHIHFPDSNRSNPNEKSNQVSIAGEMAGVERARARVRELTPLIFQFDLAIIPSFHTIPDQNNSYLRAIQDQYNVQVKFNPKQKNFHTVTVVIKGCELEASRVKEATLLLMDHLWPNNMAVNVNMSMEISPGHHAVVVGKGSINLRVIMQRTNTVIIFPDAGDPNIPPIRKGSVTISGAIHNVYLARQLLLGSLPIVMMFDIPDSCDIEEPMIQKLQAENEVTITVKPKARQSNKSCIIKTQERNVGGMYIARHKLLELEGDVVKAEIPETYKVPLVGSSSTFHLASLPANRGPFLCPTTGNAAQLQALGSPLSPNFIPSPAAVYTPVTPTFPPGSPWAFPSTAAAASGLGAAATNGLGAAAANGLGAAATNGLGAAAGGSASGLAAAAAGAVSSGTLPIPGAAEYPARLSPSQYQLQQEYMLLNVLKQQQQAAEAEKKLQLHHHHHQQQQLKQQLHQQQQLKQLQQHQLQLAQLQQLQKQQQHAYQVHQAALHHQKRQREEILAQQREELAQQQREELAQQHERREDNLHQQHRERDEMIQQQQHQTEEKQLLEKKWGSASSSPSKGEDGQNQMNYEKNKKWCSPPSNNGSKIGPSGSDLGNSIQSSPHHSPRNSSPVNAAGNLTNNLHKMDLTGSSGIEANPPDISAIMADIDLSDQDTRRASGYEKKSAESMDYEQKRMLANQAIQRMPEAGEERKPVGQWAGLGFSNTMPENILKNIGDTVEIKDDQTDAEKANLTTAAWPKNHNEIKEVSEDKLDDLGTVLLNNGLSKFSEVFRQHEIDLSTFQALTEEELKEIGINTFGPRKKLLMLAEKLRTS